MLKLMIDIVFNPPKDIAGMNDGGQQVIRMQDYMLTKMEEAGMLPPMSEETMSSNPFHVTDSILESVTHDFKWDNE